MPLDRFDPPLQPRRNGPLVVVYVCRISGLSQSELSLSDQEAMLHNLVTREYHGPLSVHVIAGRGSGEVLDRREARQLQELLDSGEIDLILTEDLGRIFRRMHAFIIAEECEDHGTRLVALNDFIDTCQNDWRLKTFFSAMRHEQYNLDTSLRIKRTQANRFLEGGILQDLIYGYIKPPGAKHDSQLQKDPAAIPIYEEWFDRLEQGASFSEIADWLNNHEIPVGPTCRTKQWTCAMVGRITRNPLLKGVRERNRHHSKRSNKTGRRKSVKSPASDLKQRHCPHLAFIEPSRYDSIITMLAARNAKYRRKLVNGCDPRANVRKKRTRWPGQHLHCQNCGGLMVYGAHGQRDRLICTNAREYRKCWMSFSVDAPKARTKLIAAISDVLKQLPGFDEDFRAKVEEQLAAATSERAGAIADADRKIAALERKIGNLTNAIAEAGSSAALVSQLTNFEAELREIEAARADARRERRLPHLPDRAELMSTWNATFEKVLATDEVAIRLLKNLVPRITVFPVRLRGGGTPVLRAKVSVDLTAAMPDMSDCLISMPDLQREIIVDLYDPPQTAAHHAEAFRLHEEGVRTELIAARLKITKTAVLNALNLHRQLLNLGVTDPYETLDSPPADYKKLRRYKHSRFAKALPPDQDDCDVA